MSGGADYIRWWNERFEEEMLFCRRLEAARALRTMLSFRRAGGAFWTERRAELLAEFKAARRVRLDPVARSAAIW